MTRAIFDYHRKTASIIIMQETHSTIECESVWESEWGGKIIYAHGTSSARGIALLTTKEFYSRISNIYTSPDGRMIIVDICEFQQTITLVAIYAPNEDFPSFFKNIDQLIQERSEHKIIIGDYNLVLNVQKDREGAATAVNFLGGHLYQLIFNLFEQ